MPSGASVWLLGFEDDGLRRELEAAGHGIELRSLTETLAEAAMLPDVGLVRSAQPMGTVRQLLALGRATAWVMLLSSEQAAQALGCLDAGATDVAIEPLAPGAAAVLVERAVQRVREQARAVNEHSAHEVSLDDIIGRSSALTSLLEKVARITRRSALGPPLSMLLTGETGTGKGLLARALHCSGRRRDGPFIEVNCAAIPASLLEAELFGHEKGAFTDARAARVGLFEAAHRGTLFLDELTYLSLEGQAKLLTALETRRVRRLGGTAERQVDVQVIAATSHDPDELVQKGTLRPELFHRLASLRFHLPPLRERGDDAALLAEHFLAKLARTYGLAPKRLSDAARSALLGYPWPGNVRELSHAVQRAVLSEEAEVVEAKDLMLADAAGATLVADDQGAVRVQLPPGGVSLDALEKAVLERALALEKGNVTRAAALLRVSRDLFRSRLEKHGLQR